MNEGQKGLSELVVSRGDASELLDTAEETLDEISVFVEMAVEGTWADTVGSGRNNSLSTLRNDRFDEGIRVVTLVCDNELGGLIFDQRSGERDIGDLPRGKNDP